MGEVRGRFPRLFPLLLELGDWVEAQGETFRLGRPLLLSWYGPLLLERFSPLLPERDLALERLIEAAHASAQAGEEAPEGEGLLGVGRGFLEGSRAFLAGRPKEALHRYAWALGQLEALALPFPATALALLAQAQWAFRPGPKAQATARKALERARTPLARALAQAVLEHKPQGEPP